MDHEERIAALEQKIDQLRADLITFNRIFQKEGGMAHAFQTAIGALIVSAPANDRIHHFLPDHLARAEASAVHESQGEEFLEGVQYAQTHILAALAESRRLAGT